MGCISQGGGRHDAREWSPTAQGRYRRGSRLRGGGSETRASLRGVAFRVTNPVVTGEYLHGTGGSQESVELAFGVEGDDAAHRAIVASADEGPVDPYRRDGSSTDESAHFRAESRAVRHLVQLDDGVLDPLCIQELLGLDTKGSSDEGQEQDGFGRDQAVELGLDFSDVVVARERAHEGLLAFVDGRIRDQGERETP